MPHPSLDTENPPLTPPWWTYPYVWMVLMGPLLVVVAALWTAFIAHQGADQVLLPNSVSPALSAEQIKSNHATTRKDLSKDKGSKESAKSLLSLEQQTATHLGDRHE